MVKLRPDRDALGHVVARVRAWFTAADHTVPAAASDMTSVPISADWLARRRIGDAAMGERAECVMLNKGAHVDDAVVVLDDILSRMAEHHFKKNALLPQLHSWYPVECSGSPK